MSHVARPHQIEALRQLKASVSQGALRVMLQIATGGGKTYIAAMVIQGARAKGKRVLFVVDSLILVGQTIRALYSFGLHSMGVIQGRHQMENWAQPIQIAT